MSRNIFYLSKYFLLKEVLKHFCKEERNQAKIIVKDIKDYKYLINPFFLSKWLLKAFNEIYLEAFHLAYKG